MKVIVTGGSGRVGKAVIEVLVRRGHEVLNLDRRPAEDGPAKFIYIDLRDRSRLQPIMEQAESIIHMGEIPDVGVGHFTDEEVFGSNCTSSSLVFQLAAELKYKRILYTSSIHVYGMGDGYRRWSILPVDESYPVAPSNSYGAAKVAVESYARLLCERKGCAIAAFRLPGVSTGDVHEHWLDSLETHKHFPAHLSIYIRSSDIGECFALALERQKPGFEIYNVSAKEVSCGIPLREGMARFCPELPKLPADWPKYKSPYLWDKAHAHFGWEPKWNILDLFRQKYGRDPWVALS